MSKGHDGWCLRGPRGKLFADTFAPTENECWAKAFVELHHAHAWMKPFWKQWDGSILVAIDHGYVMVKVRLVMVDEVG